jgi:hypothetical protein
MGRIDTSSVEAPRLIRVSGRCHHRRVTAIGQRQASIHDQLTFAIANKHLIQFRYSGAVRVAEPHDYGTRRGTTNLLVYQHRGSSGAQQKSPRGWRLLDVSKIERCSVLDESFPGIRGESHQRHYTWDVLYARVS